MFLGNEVVNGSSPFETDFVSNWLSKFPLPMTAVNPAEGICRVVNTCWEVLKCVLFTKGIPMLVNPALKLSRLLFVYT